MINPEPIIETFQHQRGHVAYVPIESAKKAPLPQMKGGTRHLGLYKHAQGGSQSEIGIMTGTLTSAPSDQKGEVRYKDTSMDCDL